MITDILRSYLKEKNFELSSEQFEYWASFFTPMKMKKNDFLLRTGEVCTYSAFVVHGCLRLYAVDNKGKEHIVQFAPENWWISDMDSFAKDTPSVYYLDALEESDVLLIDRHSHEKVLCDIPALALFFQGLLQNRQAATQKRINYSMSASAEERYLDFLKTYPSLAQRFPQHMIASYLGITPESLSRIRKKLVAKKWPNR